MIKLQYLPKCYNNIIISSRAGQGRDQAYSWRYASTWLLLTTVAIGHPGSWVTRGFIYANLALLLCSSGLNLAKRTQFTGANLCHDNKQSCTYEQDMQNERLVAPIWNIGWHSTIEICKKLQNSSITGTKNFDTLEKIC